MIELVGIHAAAIIESGAKDIFGADSQNAGRSGDRVVGVALNDQDGWLVGRCQAAFPGALKTDVSGCEECRQVGKGAAVGDEAGEFAGLPSDLLAKLLNQSPFHGGGPGAHIVDGHDLVGDRADGVEESAHGDRGGNLVADVARVVEVVSAGEHCFDESGEAFDEFCSCALGADSGFECIVSLGDVLGRREPGEDGSFGGFHLAQVLGEHVDHFVAGVSGQIG